MNIERSKKRTQSTLESIKGVGVNKRSALLNHFGGIQEIENASVDELQKVVGINYKLATKIRESLKKLQIGHKMGFNYLSRTKKNLCLPPFKDSQNFLKKKK